MPGSFVVAWFLSIPLLESSTFVVSHHGKTWVGNSVLASPVPNRLAVHNLLFTLGFSKFFSSAKQRLMVDCGHIGVACCQSDSMPQ